MYLSTDFDPSQFGGAWMQNFYANQVIGGNRAISRATLSVINQTPMFRPLQNKTVIPGPNGIIPTGLYLAGYIDPVNTEASPIPVMRGGASTGYIARSRSRSQRKVPPPTISFVALGNIGKVVQQLGRNRKITLPFMTPTTLAKMVNDTNRSVWTELENYHANQKQGTPYKLHVSKTLAGIGLTADIPDIIFTINPRKPVKPQIQTQWLQLPQHERLNIAKQQRLMLKKLLQIKPPNLTPR